MELNHQLDVISELTTHEKVVRAGYTVSQIVSDLFHLMFDTLWTFNTPLRKYTAFNPKPDIKNEAFVFHKPDLFLKKKIEETGLQVRFAGSLDKVTSGKQVAKYIQEIIGGYHDEEVRVLNILKHKLPNIVTNCKLEGININPNDVPLMFGVYHNHRLDLNESSHTIDLLCQSRLSLWL